MSKPFQRVDKNIYKRGDSFYIIIRHSGKFHRESAGHTLTAARRLLSKRKSEFNEDNFEALAKRSSIRVGLQVAHTNNRKMPSLHCRH